MPAFLERKLKDEYGKDSDIPYKVMNKLGVMKGNKETAKGRKEEKKHEKKVRNSKGFSSEGVVKRKHNR